MINNWQEIVNGTSEAGPGWDVKLQQTLIVILNNRRADFLLSSVSASDGGWCCWASCAHLVHRNDVTAHHAAFAGVVQALTDFIAHRAGALSDHRFAAPVAGRSCSLAAGAAVDRAPPHDEASSSFQALHTGDRGQTTTSGQKWRWRRCRYHFDGDGARAAIVQRAPAQAQTVAWTR